MRTKGRNSLERFILQLKAFRLNFLFSTSLTNSLVCHPFLSLEGGQKGWRMIEYIGKTFNLDLFGGYVVIMIISIRIYFLIFLELSVSALFVNCLLNLDVRIYYI